MGEVYQVVACGDCPDPAALGLLQLAVGQQLESHTLWNEAARVVAVAPLSGGEPGARVDREVDLTDGLRAICERGLAEAAVTACVKGRCLPAERLGRVTPDTLQHRVDFNKPEDPIL